MLLGQLIEKEIKARGWGERALARLTRLGIEDLRDLLLHLPKTWQDRRYSRSPSEVSDLEPGYLQARVRAHRRRSLRSGQGLLIIELDCQGSALELVCFNRDYLANTWPPGTELSIWGKFEKTLTGLTSSSFEALPLKDPLHHLEFGRWVPIYGLTDGLNQRSLRRLIFNSLAKLESLEHDLPDYLLARRKLNPLKQVLTRAHFPRDLEEAETARLELVYSELFLFELAIIDRRLRLSRVKKSHSYRNEDPVGMVEELVGFRLTPGQLEAWKKIENRLSRPDPMQVLLLGDVGSGKTLLALLAIVLAIKSGLQVALAAPTVILARQQALLIESWLSPLGVRSSFLHGALKPKDRKRALLAIGAHEVDLVIGTHALFQDQVEFKRLGLVIIDEQHRFGVNQRRSLREKGEFVDYLAMSATPIPRSLALAFYGDYERVELRGLPKGRKPVSTIWVQDGDQAKEMHEALEARLKRGEQACFVYPMIGEPDGNVKESALAAWSHYSKSAFASYGLGLLHGQMDDGEKVRVMEQFTQGELGLLIATSLIEVGIDNPNLTLMAIFSAQRFGLSQLHQMRGRVGRGNLPSICYLVSFGQESETAVVRLEQLVNSHDGFKIAEVDLELRGPGDFLGVSQAGLPEFLVADLARDLRYFSLAQKDASLILTRDPDLESEHNARLKLRFGVDR